MADSTSKNNGTRLYITGLNEEAALEIVSRALAREDTQPGQCSWHIADRGPLGLGVSIALPEAAAQACAEEMAATRPGLRLQAATPEGKVFDCASGLLLMLQPRGGSGDWDSVDDEILIVCASDDSDRVDSLFREISFGATYTRVAAASAPGADGTGMRTLWLFHVKDDQKRTSTLAGSTRSGAFDDCSILRAYQDEGHTLFFPEGVHPQRERFRILRQLAKDHPGLLGTALPKKGPVLAGVPGAGPSDPLTILWLGGLADAAAELDNLRLRIAQAGPRAGYPLRLAPAPLEGAGSSERMRLRQRLAETRQRLAYLESLDQSHPILYRFSQPQLEQLAGLLAGFPVEALKDGELLYGFYADEENPEGFHFLLVEPEHALVGLLGPAFSTHGNGADRFQVDPLWAGAYFDPERPALVFVPFGQRLTPSMHAWNASEMDEYLAESVETWAKAQGKIAKALPERPLYLFDELPDASGQNSQNKSGTNGANGAHRHVRLRVSVLDRDAFAPLRERMGWINENLLVTRDLGMQEYVTQLATATSRASLLERKQDQADTRLEEFSETLEVLNKQVLARTRGYLKVLDDRVGKSLGQVESMRRELDSLEQSLAKLQAARSDMKRDHASTLRDIETDLNGQSHRQRRTRTPRHGRPDADETRSTERGAAASGQRDEEGVVAEMSDEADAELRAASGGGAGGTSGSGGAVVPPAIPVKKTRTTDELTFELGESWDRLHDQREDRIEVMHQTGEDTLVEARRMESLLETWRQVVVPITKRWRGQMKQATKVPPYVDELKQEWRRAVWARPSRHWAGFLIRWRLRFLHFFVLAFALGKILAVVLFVVVMIYFILEWTRGNLF